MFLFGFVCCFVFFFLGGDFLSPFVFVCTLSSLQQCGQIAPWICYLDG